MYKFDNTSIDLEVRGMQISGIITGKEGFWEFRSLDPVFMKLCPLGHMYNFSDFGEMREKHLHRLVYAAITDRVSNMHSE